MSVSDKRHKKKRVAVIKVYFYEVERKKWDEWSLYCSRDWRKVAIHVKSVPDRTSKWKAHDDLYIIFEEMQGSHQNFFTTLSTVFQKSQPHCRNSINNLMTRSIILELREWGEECRRFSIEVPEGTYRLVSKTYGLVWEKWEVIRAFGK